MSEKPRKVVCEQIATERYIKELESAMHRMDERIVRTENRVSTVAYAIFAAGLCWVVYLAIWGTP